MQSAWRALLQNIKLMPQDQVFGFQPPPRFEAVAQHADEKNSNCMPLFAGDCQSSGRSWPEFSEATRKAMLKKIVAAALALWGLTAGPAFAHAGLGHVAGFTHGFVHRRIEFLSGWGTATKI